MQRKQNKGRWWASVEDSMDESIGGLEVYIKKSKEADTIKQA